MRGGRLQGRPPPLHSPLWPFKVKKYGAYVKLGMRDDMVFSVSYLDFAKHYIIAHFFV